MLPRRADLGVIVLLKALACALALAVGFRAVSDDDFARVTIAQAFAHSPQLDPTGTSWLPFPFWLTGSVMIAAGRTLFVARFVAILLGLLSAVLVAFAAYRLTDRREGALLGALLAAVFPWSVRLGVATVPELLTAAFAVFALASLVGRDARSRLLGAAALLCATLSRYDVWPIAAAFSAFTLFDMFRWDKPSERERFFLGAATILAMVGPALWIAWNHVARGNAFDFLDRVAAYRRALGTPDDGAIARLFAYPVAMVRHEPEIFGALLILFAIGRSTPLRPLVRETLRPYARPLIIAFFQMALLSVAMIKDGAPTHHPERALLVMLLLCALLAGNLAVVLLPRTGRTARLLSGAAAVGVLLFSLIIVRRWFRGEDFTVRQDEVSTGHYASQVLRPGEKILVHVVDYGYFAFVAAFARPEDTVLDRDLDPRSPKSVSSFDDRAALLRKLEAERVSWVVAHVSSPAAKTLGPAQFVHGGFGVWNERSWR